MSIDGNASRNNLLGTLDPDVINGLGDDDTLRGGGGADTLNGGDDDDILFAVNDPIDHDKFDDAAHDYALFGDGDADVLNGEGGDDELVGDFRSIYDGGTGDDRAFVSLTEASSAVTFNYGGGTSLTFSFVVGGVNRGSMFAVEHVDIYGSAFNDVLSVADGDDNIQAFGGNDTVNGNAGNDELRGGDGNDSLTGGIGRDTVAGGSGADSLFGNEENDNLFANAQPTNYTSFDDPETDFTIFGNGAADTLNGGTGTDHLVGDEYTTYDGGTGTDTAYVSVINATAALTFTYDGSNGTPSTFFTGGIARGTVMNVEAFYLYGTNLGDNIVLHDGSDRVQANGGDDVVDGMAGGDTLAGGDGDDFLSGGDGNDALLSVAEPGDYETFDDDNVDKDKFGDGAAETLFGGAGNDKLVGDLYGTYHGDDGNDRAFVSFTEATAAMRFTDGGQPATGYYFIMGGVAQGVAYDIENFDIYGSSYNDVFNMSVGDDRIEGWGGNDTINGNEGDDVLRGNSGNDLIDGGLDDDELGGNVGRDTLNGGQGNDIIFALVEPKGYEVFDRSTIDLTDFGIHQADRLNGGDGDDALIGDYYALFDGGTGGDRAYVSLFDATAAVTFIYGAAADIPYAFTISGVDYGNIRNVENFDIYGSLFNDVLTLAGGDDNIQAKDGDDLVNGNGGHDQLRGAVGFDTLNGGTGNDTLTGGEGGDSLDGGDGDDVLFAATEPADYAIFEDRSTRYVDHGDADGDTLFGGIGNDRLIGDHFTVYNGGAGSDRAYISLFEAVAGVTFKSSGGSATYNFVVDGITHGSVTSVEAFDIYGSEYGDFISLSSGNDNVQGHGGDDSLAGGDGNDVLHGGDGDDRLVGGPGADTMAGGLGDDTYGVTTADDVIIEAANEGRDTIERNTTSTLAGIVNIENLTIVGSANIDGSGNEFDNVITGNSGNNTLTGDLGNDTLVSGGGSDTMIGGSGNDVYRDVTGDTVVELAGGGTDAIESYVNFSLALVSNIENLFLIGTSNVSATGDNLANRVGGNSGNNEIQGLGGVDTLTGGDGNDTLDGGAGADSMSGGKGDDTYWISEAGDAAVELANEGNDTVYTSLNWTLGGNVEGLRLLGTGNVNGTGNELSNRLIGNDGANQLKGLGGNDMLTAGGGADDLDGGAGADTMNGGAGNDVYHVDQLDDRTEEAEGFGKDTVYSLVNWRLSANTEVLYLEGTNNTNGLGNELRNWIYGNTGNNKLQGLDGNDSLTGAAGDDELDGGTGADTLVGGAGDDIYRVDSGTDVTVEAAGEGKDTVYSAVSRQLDANIEVLRLLGSSNTKGYGNDGANEIYGNSGANEIRGFGANDLIEASGGKDTLDGGDGADTLSGAGGNDILTGGAGADVFRFTTSNANVDKITDFNTTVDRFDLSGGSFSAVVERQGLTRLEHDGGVINVLGVTGLTLDQWNALVVSPGSSARAADAGRAYLSANDEAMPGVGRVDLVAAFAHHPVYLTHADFL